MPEQALWTGYHQSARICTTAMQVGPFIEGARQQLSHCNIHNVQAARNSERRDECLYLTVPLCQVLWCCVHKIAGMHPAESYDDLDAGWAADIFGIPHMRQQLLSLASGNVLEVQTVKSAASPCLRMWQKTPWPHRSHRGCTTVMFCDCMFTGLLNGANSWRGTLFRSMMWCL